MTTPIFTPEQAVKYAENRLFGKNVGPEEVTQIRLYNGILPSELEEMLHQDYAEEPLRVNQENGREPIYLTSNGALHIPQYSGFGRRKRYEEMIRAYLNVSKRPMEFTSLEVGEEERRTNIAYDNFAYDFVTGLFVPDKKYRRVLNIHDIRNIDTIIFGRTKAVSNQAEITSLGQSDYLRAQLIRAHDKIVLNVDEVYADQAGIIIDKMLREYEALARKEGKRREISIFMFGRVGGLDEKLQRHDLVFPTGFIDDVDLQEGIYREYPMHNVLAEGGAVSFNLNVNSVLGETREQLELARNLGCASVEMETREAVESINRARRRYRDHLSIRFGFVGYVSDCPLKGDTLAEEMDSDKGEQEAVGRILGGIASAMI